MARSSTNDLAGFDIFKAMGASFRWSLTGPLVIAVRCVMVCVFAALVGCAADNSADDASKAAGSRTSLFGAPASSRDQQRIVWVWNEECRAAIRVDRARPTVQARTLFHVSAAMYDAWAAYDATASGYLFTQKVRAASPARNIDADRRVTISYAAYGLLKSRYGRSPGSVHTMTALEGRMRDLGLPLADAALDDDSPAGLGNRIAMAYANLADSDGSRELRNYLEQPRFVPANPPQNVDAAGCVLKQPDKWQPLTVDGATQRTITPHWGSVKTFASALASKDAAFKGPPTIAAKAGEASQLTELRRQLVEVITMTAAIDESNADTIDISPAVMGNNTLGVQDGHGRSLNPITNAAYPANIAKVSDFGRVLADFWADGPGSDTPPGHWNDIALQISQSPHATFKLFGQGTPVPRDEWDLKVLLALNAALHDAAINSWDLKTRFESVRPFSIIRWMGINGQCSDPALPAYHEQGLPLMPGLIELITTETTAIGQRHAHLKGSEGKIAIRTWMGPLYPQLQAAGVQWRLASDWKPFQQWDFVTPAFPGYVSGHSTFSRAAAEVLAAITGSEFFPGGMLEIVVPARTGLKIEPGPSQDVKLQWATYFDAADSSGMSRRWGGIHIEADDLDGRLLGAQVGRTAIERARQLFAGNRAKAAVGKQ